MFLLISTLLMDMGMPINSLSLIFLCTIPNMLIDLPCFPPHFKSAAGRFLGSEGQRDTCLTTRSSFASLDFLFDGCGHPGTQISFFSFVFFFFLLLFFLFFVFVFFNFRMLSR
jgi:hypothetical protein